MKKKLLMVGLMAFLLPLSGVAAGVWKCQENGRVVFSDTPCPDSGRALDPSVLQGNTVQAERVQPGRVEPVGEYNGGNTRVVRRRAPQNECPSDQEIRNLETKATSITLGQQEREFLYDEVRRARQCQKGQGSYSKEDWQAVRDGQDAQSSLTGRETGRRRAEGVHSAASPLEGNRIHERRLEEERLRRQREMMAAHPRPPERYSIRECDDRGCWTSGGYRPSTGHNSYSGPEGKTCRQVGFSMECN